ncbi:MAG TPA: caspase family protein [Candidatus Anoxymicrobiaceae bacterium]|jgi:metacaspase-1
MATEKRALCVGINKFKNFSDHNLQGCVNDANDMAGVLKEFLGLKAAEITVLTDAKATKAKIMINLEKMVKDAHAGKLSNLVFSMSSHGTQVPDVGGDEPDRYDEAFCPHDLASTGSAWDPAHIIVDDELRDLFAQLPDGVNLEVWLDTCHSGTGLKAIDMLMDRAPRYIPPPTLEAFFAVDNKRPRGLARGLLEKGITDQVLWAACRADQTSADANIDGGWHGAFTYYFCNELRASRNKLTRAKLLAKVRGGLSSDYNQIPQLECDASKRKQKLG